MTCPVWRSFQFDTSLVFQSVSYKRSLRACARSALRPSAGARSSSSALNNCRASHRTNAIKVDFNTNSRRMLCFCLRCRFAPGDICRAIIHFKTTHITGQIPRTLDYSSWCLEKEVFRGEEEDAAAGGAMHQTAAGARPAAPQDHVDAGEQDWARRAKTTPG